VAGSNVIEKTSTLITQACSKFNTLYKVGLGRCSALCKDHRCCFDLSVGPCVEKPPNFFYGYEDFSNLLTDSVTLVNEFCSVSKIESVLGYSVCSTLCTERLCCFQPGDKSCTEKYPDWCKEFEACHNTKIEDIFDTYKETDDRKIVDKICSDENISSGKDTVDNCEQICSIRAYCFFEGRANCYKDNLIWCDEFASCFYSTSKVSIFTLEFLCGIIT